MGNGSGRFLTSAFLAASFHCVARQAPRVDPHPLDAPWVGVEDFEFEA